MTHSAWVHSQPTCHFVYPLQYIAHIVADSTWGYLGDVEAQVAACNSERDLSLGVHVAVLQPQEDDSAER